ncbi:MAG: ATP synthase F1 subunit gamma [Patescibacteria group bacterium]
MPTATRDIQRRIRSVTSTKKITKAMELVASAKMRRAGQAVLAARPYTDRAWEMLLHLSRRTDPAHHALLAERVAPKKIGVILVASNRGLVGGFNAQLTATVAKEIKNLNLGPHTQAEVILMGKRGRMIMTQHGLPIDAEFTKDDVVTSVLGVRPMAKLAIERFTERKYDRVLVGFMDYISMLVQKPRLRQILPLSGAGFEAGAVGLVSNEEQQAIKRDERAAEREFEYLFEPNPDAVLDYVLPRLVEMQIYRAVLETNAAEQAARMVAMKNASDAAGDLIDDLTLTFNQARQASITQDLAEISAGRAALES